MTGEITGKYYMDGTPLTPFPPEDSKPLPKNDTKNKENPDDLTVGISMITGKFFDFDTSRFDADPTPARTTKQIIEGLNPNRKKPT